MYYKKLLIVICLGITSFLHAQKKETFYVFKEDWSAAKDMNDAFYFMQQLRENDTTYTCKFYRVFGPMVKMETYRDADLTTPMGRFAWYNEKGYLDSTGEVYYGRKDGSWSYHFDSGKAMITSYYDKGKLQSTRDEFNKVIRMPDGSTKPFEPIDTTGPKDETEKEAIFKGGGKAWRFYLEKNLVVPKRFLMNVPRGNSMKAEVIISFNVEKDGSLNDIFLYRTSEWSVDTEALRLIKTAPRWSPAIQKGVPVIYRQKQSITFVAVAD
jgi:hypothetical protein